MTACTTRSVIGYYNRTFYIASHRHLILLVIITACVVIRSVL